MQAPEKHNGQQVSRPKANTRHPPVFLRRFNTPPQGIQATDTVGSPPINSLRPRRVAAAGRLFLLSRLLLIGRSIAALSSLFLFLLAQHESNDASLGNSKGAGAVGPLFVGLHLIDSLGACEDAASLVQTALALQTLINGHVKRLQSHNSVRKPLASRNVVRHFRDGPIRRAANSAENGRHFRKVERKMLVHWPPSCKQTGSDFTCRSIPWRRSAKSAAWSAVGRISNPSVHCILSGKSSAADESRRADKLLGDRTAFQYSSSLQQVRQ